MTIPKIFQNPGAATVADLRFLDGDRALAVLLYRDWFEGESGRARVAELFDQALARSAPSAVNAWADLMGELVAHARRPLMRHDLKCQCVGADEATFAQLLSLAASGEREEALLILALLMPADRSLCALQAAECCGRNLRLCALRMAATVPQPSRLH